MAALISAVLISLSSCSQPASEQAAPVLRVVTETIAPQTDFQSRTYVGVVEEEEAVSVSFMGLGTVSRVYVDEGQAVSRGQLLAEMDATQALNALRTAQAAASQAEDALARYRIVYERGSLAEASWVEAQSKVEQARATLQMAQKNVADCKIYAPQSGMIGSKMLSAGMTALPSQPVVRILNINNVKVRCAIPEREMPAIRPDSKTRIEVAAATIEVEGGKIEKGVAADPMTHTYDIRINVANPDRKLLPGMVASVSINNTYETAAEAITVPITSVQRSANGQMFVWTISVNKAHRVPVVLGDAVGNRIAIVSGLNQGDRIVIEGYHKLSEGSNVIY